MFFSLSIFYLSIEGKEIPCESVTDINWSSLVGTVKSCMMRPKTSINELNVKISPFDDSIKGLELMDNKNIFYLPVQVGVTFPNLLGYDARNCFIKEIFKENFKGLNKLRKLWLYGNLIERITSETFEDLQALEKLWLGEKKKFHFLFFH